MAGPLRRGGSDREKGAGCQLGESLCGERKAGAHEARVRAPALSLRDPMAHLVRLLREPGFLERPAIVADVANLPLHLAERDRPLRVQDSRDRAGIALVDHPLLLEGLELRLAGRDLEVPEDRAIAVEPRP